MVLDNYHNAGHREWTASSTLPARVSKAVDREAEAAAATSGATETTTATGAEATSRENGETNV